MIEDIKLPNWKFQERLDGVRTTYYEFKYHSREGESYRTRIKIRKKDKEYVLDLICEKSEQTPEIIKANMDLFNKVYRKIYSKVKMRSLVSDHIRISTTHITTLYYQRNQSKVEMDEFSQQLAKRYENGHFAGRFPLKTD